MTPSYSFLTLDVVNLSIAVNSNDFNDAGTYPVTLVATLDNYSFFDSKTFNVWLRHTCTESFLSLTKPANMTIFIKIAEAVQTFTAATVSLEVTFFLPGLCGPIDYTITT